MSTVPEISEAEARNDEKSVVGVIVVSDVEVEREVADAESFSHTHRRRSTRLRLKMNWSWKCKRSSIRRSTLEIGSVCSGASTLHDDSGDKAALPE